MIEIKEKLDERICQGDVFRNVEHLEYYKESDGNIEVSKIIFPYVVILTQDCDLAQDASFRANESKRSQDPNFKASTSQKNDKYLISILVAPLYNAEHVFEGSHLSELEWKMEPIQKSKTPGKYLKQNNNPRYHYLDFSKDVQIPPSIVDFKHYFSVNVEYMKSIKKDNCICQVAELYREQLSHRFAHFLSRVGLPDNPQECMLPKDSK